MAEERNPVTGAVAGETGEIRDEIARTRSEMSNTIGEIQDRLKPEHLIQQAKDSVQEAAAVKMRTIMHSANDAAGAVAGTTRRAADQATEYVKHHPVQVALLAAGVTWLMTRNNRHEWRGTRGYHVASDWQGSDAAEGYAAQAKDKTREVVDQVRDAASHATTQVRDAASAATEQVQQSWQRAGHTSQRWLTENPLAVGVAAVAAGVALGLVVPGTRLEDRTLGETRDSMVEKAGEAARGLRDAVAVKAKDVAAEVMNEVAPAALPPAATPPAAQSAALPGSPAGGYRPT